MADLEDKINKKNLKEAFWGTVMGLVYETMPPHYSYDLGMISLQGGLLGTAYVFGAPKLRLTEFPNKKEKIKGGFAVGFGFIVGRTIATLIRPYF
ncbi:MAG: hypothetical protein KKA65_00815 [Nanoarchaeota archaeon]|nr:hypothetical protein [Nanoarchaeota archaeon]MBU4242258.1 hypothetical protein [Nanoarchaeota archaeon]MBU4352263.1 hypothetical protein [Nanoarchaeota archaeon]MBU4456019.1 hypothetical protein [Nanoarchaeota archaeon]MCG2719529.1 hypothetical protein [Nanoarchaeota archaeon]